MIKTYDVELNGKLAKLVYEYNDSWFQAYIDGYMQLASIDFDKLTKNEHEKQFQGIINDIAKGRLKIEEYSFFGKTILNLNVKESEVWSDYPRSTSILHSLAMRFGKLRHSYLLKLSKS